jgi:hypothetical protein
MFSCQKSFYYSFGSLVLMMGFNLSPVNGSNEAMSIEPRQFLEDYCLRCHGEEKQKGDRRFDHLDLAFSDEDTAFEWQEILDMINLGDMPPEEEEEQPSDEERTGIVSWITPQLEIYYANQAEKESTGLRRMNSFQYRNTLRDLLGLDISSFDPTESFPSEERLDGFENIGSRLVVSRYLMDRYLEAASASIDKVVDIPSRPSTVSDRFTAEDFWDRRWQFRGRSYWIVNTDGKYVEMGHGDKSAERIYPLGFGGFKVERVDLGDGTPRDDEGPKYRPRDRSELVPQDGYYTITVNAEAVGRQHPYTASIFDVDLSEPMKLEIFANDARIESAKYENPSNRTVAVFPLADNEAREYKVRVWLDKGFNFGIRYPNGPRGMGGTIRKVMEQFHPETIASNYKDLFSDKPAEPLDTYISDVYEGPRIRIHWVKFEGPDTEVWPPRNYQRLLGTTKHGQIGKDPYELIREFARKAFRRPVSNSEFELYQKFYDKEIASGSAIVSAIADTYKAILTSPNFLYIEAPINEASVDATEEGHVRKLKAYNLAARLSYFLWCSTPDQELLNAAEKGTLFEPIEIKYQALRMLRDPRAEAFVGNFTDGWLGLHKLGNLTPDQNKYEAYSVYNLENSFRGETRAFFRYLLEENRDIEEFLSAEYSFLDRNLAKHYGIDYADLDDEPRMVRFPEDSFRGGLLGQAGIHTVTANGVDTSPVVRGIWILENLLGTPPSPPPPDVPALEPDIRGATSIRDQLSKHREMATCNECHRKMDPLGFALENFDAIGGFREFYREGKDAPAIPVDTSGKLPSGEAFDDVRDLKKILLDRKEQFVRCLTEKLLMYALGRELSFSDRPQINAIVEELERRGGGLQDLVEIVVCSEAFIDS